ncbi:MAG: hypothetical protein AAGD43_29605 [Pseudomonadota bacterium]
MPIANARSGVSEATSMLSKTVMAEGYEGSRLLHDLPFVNLNL